MSAGESIVFCTAALFANFGIAFTGWWDHAIWWALIYVIGVFAGGMDCSECGIKNALFHQAIAVGAGLPIMLWSLRATIREHSHLPFILVFGIATAGGSPIGKFLHSDVIPTNFLFLITGVVTILTEINLICKLKAAAAVAAGRTSAVQEAWDEENKDEEKDADQDHLTTPLLAGEEAKDEEDTDEVALTGLKPLVMGFLTSLLSGYLGGLCGVRGPPLLVLAKIFPFPKPCIQAHASILLAINVYARLVWYACVVRFESASNHVDGAGLEWHYMGQGYLYVFTAGFGILGTVLGLNAARSTDVNTFLPYIAVLLLIGGVFNLAWGIMLQINS